MQRIFVWSSTYLVHFYHDYETILPKVDSYFSIILRFKYIKIKTV